MEQKPIILEIEEAKQELIKCVNNILSTHRLSCYLMEPIFADIYTQIKTGAKNEIAQAKASMKAQTQMAETQVEGGAE